MTILEKQIAGLEKSIDPAIFPIRKNKPLNFRVKAEIRELYYIGHDQEAIKAAFDINANELREILKKC